MNSLRENNVKEIIVVDANSNDGTKEIATEIADKVLDDPRLGLAVARNIGISECTTYYVINVGADNIMPRGSIQIMLETKLQMNWAAVSATTVMSNPKLNYYSWAMNKYKAARYFPGERAVIGTPTLFVTSLLKRNPFDPKMSHSDDGDLCSRLSEEGHKFGIADVEVFELGSENLSSLKTRWENYGKSDWETYKKFSPSWSIKRKMYSLTYPLRNELILPILRIKGIAKFGAIPFLMLVTCIRYWSWIQYSLKHKGKKL